MLDSDSFQIPTLSTDNSPFIHVCIAEGWSTTSPTKTTQLRGQTCSDTLSWSRDFGIMCLGGGKLSMEVLREYPSQLKNLARRNLNTSGIRSLYILRWEERIPHPHGIVLIIGKTQRQPTWTASSMALATLTWPSRSSAGTTPHGQVIKSTCIPLTTPSKHGNWPMRYFQAALRIKTVRVTDYLKGSRVYKTPAPCHVTPTSANQGPRTLTFTLSAINNDFHFLSSGWHNFLPKVCRTFSCKASRRNPIFNRTSIHNRTTFTLILKQLIRISTWTPCSTLVLLCQLPKVPFKDFQ